MPRFFADEKIGNELIITDSVDVRHLEKVLRLRLGDEVELVFEKTLYSASLTSISKNAGFHIDEIIKREAVRPRLTLIQGMPKGQKISDILMHGTEVGIDEFILVTMERSIAKRDEEKLERYQRILKDASKQSKRFRIPEVSFSRLTAIDFSQFNRVYFFYEESNERLSVTPSDTNVAFIIGPEGGFSRDEVIFLRSRDNVQEASLGDTILRTETAGLVAGAIIRHEMESK